MTEVLSLTIYMYSVVLNILSAYIASKQKSRRTASTFEETTLIMISKTFILLEGKPTEHSSLSRNYKPQAINKQLISKGALSCFIERN